MKHIYQIFTAIVTSLSLSACNLEPEIASGREYTNHKYWDGKKAPAISDASCDIQKQELFKTYGRPELMAIGDSLYNGVQSLRINWWLSEWSAPSLVAIGMGLIKERNGDRNGDRSFYGPQYPDQGKSPSKTRSYGFNLEALPSPLQYGKIVPNQRDWLQELAFSYVPKNGRVMVDNLSFSGANSIDLLDVAAGLYGEAAKDTLGRMKSFDRLSDAFFYSNAYFVLNPTKNRCVDKMTVIQQVEFRRPKRLLVNIGANNGLYRIAFLAAGLDSGKQIQKFAQKKSTKELSDLREPNLKIREFSKEKLHEDMARLIARLSAIDGLEEVYINNLALPSQPANMIATPGGFRSALFYSKVVRSQDMVANDTFVRGVNDELRKLIEMTNRTRATGPRFVYVDVAKVLDKYDYKACIGQKPEAECKDKRFAVSGEIFGFPASETVYLDNRPINPVATRGYTTGADFKPKLSQGGLFSFDNMHLSTVGYELMAQAVLKSMPSANLAPQLRPLTPDRCPGPKSQNLGKAAVGDCVALLVTPGWSVADINRREFNFLRIAGEKDGNRQELFSFLSRFAN